LNRFVIILEISSFRWRGEEEEGTKFEMKDKEEDDESDKEGDKDEKWSLFSKSDLECAREMIRLDGG
jgi:hypothetical protein